LRAQSRNDRIHGRSNSGVVSISDAWRFGNASAHLANEHSAKLTERTAIVYLCARFQCRRSGSVKEHQQVTANVLLNHFFNLLS